MSETLQDIFSKALVGKTIEKVDNDATFDGYVITEISFPFMNQSDVNVKITASKGSGLQRVFLSPVTSLDGIVNHITFRRNNRACCMCRTIDSNVRTLSTYTPVHEKCLHAAGLSDLIEKIGWMAI